MREFYKIYFMNEDGRCDCKRVDNKEDAIKEAQWRYTAWGRPDIYVKVIKVIEEEIEFKK